MKQIIWCKNETNRSINNMKSINKSLANERINIYMTKSIKK